MNYKLILIACAASILLLSGCDKAKEAAETTKETATKAADKAGNIAADAKDMASNAAGKVGDVAADAKNMASNAAGKVGDVAADAKNAMSGGTPSKETFAAALSAAKELNSKAADMGTEWRDTGKLLKTAEKAAGDGDFAKAIELANTAKMQAETAMQQSESMKDAGPRF